MTSRVVWNGDVPVDARIRALGSDLEESESVDDIGAICQERKYNLQAS